MTGRDTRSEQMTRYDATPDRAQPRDGDPLDLDVPDEHLELTDGPDGGAPTGCPPQSSLRPGAATGELVWELSALHLHWLGAYDPEQHGSAPLGWHRDFADARERLRDWVATCGTRLDRDRPTRQTLWPGEPPNDTADDETVITDRRDDFLRFVTDDVNARRTYDLRGTESTTKHEEVSR